MPIKSLSQSSLTNFQKYSSMLAGNAAFSPSAYDLLETQVLTSSASSVTFTGLGSYTDYKHLQIRFTARTTRPSGDDLMLMRINGDTSVNYNAHNITGTGSSVSSNSNTTSAYLRNNMRIAGNTAASGIFGMGVIDILDFQSTSKYKTLRYLGGAHTGSTNEITLGSGALRSTNAITTIEFAQYLTSSNFVGGTRFSLYGVK